MKLDRPPSAVRDTEDQLIPLINIVFLLLIFFMLAGAVTRPHSVDVDPPKADVDGDKPQREMILYLDADGALTLDDTAVELKDLASAVDADNNLLLRADADTDSRRVVMVLHALREAGLERVRLVTRKEAE